jgi:hypothetical protein
MSNSLHSRNLDFALVGHNFFAFLLSIGLLNRGKKVLVLDDDRFNYGDFFTNSLTAMDVEFLKSWGAESNLSPLANIESYLTPSRVYFFVGKKQVVLGDVPHRNFRELCRKFPGLFLAKEADKGVFSHENEIVAFDNVYNDFCQKISAVLFNEKSPSKMSFLFESSLPEGLKNNFNHFFSHFDKKDKMSEVERYDFNALMFMTRGFFQNRMSITGSKSELMHLFFSLISPYYKLDHERLIADLLKHHLEKGGEFKKLNLSDLKFHSGLVQSFELESFDGTIRPNKMAFIGGYPVNLPIKLGPASSTSYNCLHVEFTFKSPVPKLLEGKKCVFTSPIKIGTDRPFWEVYFNGNKAIFNIIMAKKEGTKIDFIFERVKNILIEDLDYLFPEYDFDLADCKMKFTLDVFIEDKDYNAHKRTEATFKKKIVEVLEDTAPLLMSKLKNVLYFGPYNEDSLGTFSSLVEIKRWRETL